MRHPLFQNLVLFLQDDSIMDTPYITDHNLHVQNVFFLSCDKGFVNTPDTTVFIYQNKSHRDSRLPF